MQIDIGGGVRVNAPATSLKDLRDQNVVRQRFDFSCGAAALATVLRYGFGDDVTERDILRQLFDSLSADEQAVVRSTGFSLLHLQRVAQARGYEAEGFRLQPGQLPLLDGPVMVFIAPRGYKHFAVLRGVRDGRVYLADPSRGTIRVPSYAFLDDWLQDDGLGIIFVVEPNTGLPTGPTPLTVRGTAPPPEVMTARELLGVGGTIAHVAIP
jgi:predicted double-glycine peptidase